MPGTNQLNVNNMNCFSLQWSSLYLSHCAWFSSFSVLSLFVWLRGLTRRKKGEAVISPSLEQNKLTFYANSVFLMQSSAVSGLNFYRPGPGLSIRYIDMKQKYFFLFSMYNFRLFA